MASALVDPSSAPSGHLLPEGEGTPSCSFAQVLVSVEIGSLTTRIFTYRVPEVFQETIAVGQTVLIPFGSHPAVLGFVVDLTNEYTHTAKAREIVDVLSETPLFDAAYYDFLNWVARYYACPIQDVIDCALPAGLIQKIKKEVSWLPEAPLPENAGKLASWLHNKAPKAYSPKHLSQQCKLSLKEIYQRIAELKKLGCVSVEHQMTDAVQAKMQRFVQLGDVSEKLTDKQQSVVDYLRDKSAVSEKVVLSELQIARSIIQRLEQKGVLQLTEHQVIRDPLAHYQQLARAQSPIQLSEGQQAAVDRILETTEDHSTPYLLYGVTGSGKTEVYLTLTRRLLEANQSVLVLVPEIALTSQLARRFIHHFGQENIALWHSQLSAGEKADTWRRLATGDLKILIAARSGIWAPLANLGMVIFDEEHDGSYKQDSPNPRYDARVLARELSRRTGCKILLGSATPDMTTFREAMQSNRVVRLSERFGGRNMATVKIVDMKQEAIAGVKGHLSRLLLEELGENLARGEQSIILINRRGFHTAVQCVHCEYVFRCPDCDVSLTYHKTVNSMRCHYCGHESEKPNFCPQCASNAIQQTGVGTQRIEAAIADKFPECRILRMDTDTTRHKDAHRQIYERFAAGEADVLIGTQMVAKGLDVANVTLVGVIATDSTFCMPDFKATERGFQLLTQVAGRAGRGDKPGRVIFQTIDAEHPVIQLSQAQDYEGFYNYETASREGLNFPPYSQLFRLIVSAPEEKMAWQFSQAVAAHLQRAIDVEQLQQQILISGPASCLITRIQNRYRFHLLVKSQAGDAGHALVTKFYQAVKPPEAVNFLLDVDALTLL